MWFDDAIVEPPKELLDMLTVALKSGPGMVSMLKTFVFSFYVTFNRIFVFSIVFP